MNEKHKWVAWANEMQSIAQNGLTYSRDQYDIARFTRLQALSAEILSHHSNEDFEKIHSIFVNEKYYLTPKVDVRVAIIQDNQILLVRERSDKKWTVPGGWADVNESPSECAIKEVLEETGYHVQLIKLYGLLDKYKWNYPPQIPHTYKCFFLGKIIGGAPQPNIEISEITFFERENLPELSLQRVSPEQIAMAFKHYQEMGLQTDFD